MRLACLTSLLAITVLVVAGCGDDDDNAASAPTTGSERPGSEVAELSGAFDIGGRALILSCHGEGSPTVIMEPGQGVSRSSYSEQQDALPAPDGVPMILLHSDDTQCDGPPGDPCLDTTELYLTLGEEYAAAWPGARFAAVSLSHQIQIADEDRVLTLDAAQSSHRTGACRSGS